MVSNTVGRILSVNSTQQAPSVKGWVKIYPVFWCPMCQLLQDQINIFWNRTKCKIHTKQARYSSK